MRTQVWSCGGGVQSAAIAALIYDRKLPKPDVALIVDTGREKESTWAYLENVIRPKLLNIGLEIHRVRTKDFATVGLYSTKGKLLIPAFTNQSGDQGKFTNYCSGEWKSRVIDRWLRSQGIKEPTNWLGISLDELARVRAGAFRYPLIYEVPMRRQDCINLLQNMGWPEAPRSACWMCPNMKDAEWREMKDNRPLEFAKAVRFDNGLRKKDPNVFVHESCKPLGEVDFTNYQGSLLSGCSSGHCFT